MKAVNQHKAKQISVCGPIGSTYINQPSAGTILLVFKCEYSLISVTLSQFNRKISQNVKTSRKMIFWLEPPYKTKTYLWNIILTYFYKLDYFYLECVFYSRICAN